MKRLLGLILTLTLTFIYSMPAFACMYPWGPNKEKIEELRYKQWEERYRQDPESYVPPERETMESNFTPGCNRSLNMSGSHYTIAGWGDENREFGRAKIELAKTYYDQRTFRKDFGYGEGYTTWEQCRKETNKAAKLAAEYVLDLYGPLSETEIAERAAEWAKYLLDEYDYELDYESEAAELIEWAGAKSTHEYEYSSVNDWVPISELENWYRVPWLYVYFIPKHQKAVEIYNYFDNERRKCQQFFLDLMFEHENNFCLCTTEIDEEEDERIRKLFLEYQLRQ